MRRTRSTLTPQGDSQSTPAQRSLLAGFWPEDEQSSTEANVEEDQRFHQFFKDSIFNEKAKVAATDASVSRRIQVGLYPADADLLEELFLQSKAAGLKNVSRARILRVALRHFHTCWLNAES